MESNRQRLRVRPTISLFVLLLFLPFGTSASSKGRGTYHDRARSSISALVGSFNGEDEPDKLENEGSSFTLGVGFDYRINPYVTLGGELVLAAANYDNLQVSSPLFGSVSSRMDLDRSSLLLEASGIYPIARFEPYIGAGIGLSKSEASVSGDLFGFPGEVEESDTSLQYDLFVGADFVVTRKLDIGFQVRDSHIDADFGELTDGSVDIGGRSLALTFKFYVGEWGRDP